MPNRRTTDNFLSASRGKSTYVSRPTVFTHRREYTHQAAKRWQPIDNVLPPKTYSLKSQAVLTSSGVPVQSVATLWPVVLDLPPKAKTRSKVRLSQKQLLYALAVIVLLFGAVASVASFRGRPQETQPDMAVQAAVTEPPSPPPQQEQVVFGLPVRLKIPTINVDAALDRVGLTPQGALDVPKGPANAAWYDKGPRPGEKGSAVIDGHFGWAGDTPAVFDNLHKLQKGSELQVEDEKGTIITFVVRELRTYGPEEDASSVFGASDGEAHLNLITCHGAWSKADKSYTTRLVVFADKKM